MKKIKVKNMKEICEKYKVDIVQTENFINLCQNFNDVVELFEKQPTEKLLSLSLRFHKTVNDQINNFLINYQKFYKEVDEIDNSPIALLKKRIENR